MIAAQGGLPKKGQSMNNYQPVERDKKGGIKFRYIFALMLFTFAGGAILSVWAADRLDLFGNKAAAIERTNVPPLVEARPAFGSLLSNGNATTANVEPVADRVEDLEARLSRINVDAAAASGNANRAEGMLVAFAARRAIDSGADLGYIANQLTDRFGAAQPQAVAQILSAADNSITLDQLRAELETDGNRWLAPAGMTVWAKFRLELSELFILRTENTPSPAPSRRLERAKQYAALGNIAAAMNEVTRLPGKMQASDWSRKAQSYISVRAALDKIERAALVQPLRTIAPAPIEPATVFEPATPDAAAITAPSTSEVQ
jgi:hypothetical protein